MGARSRRSRERSASIPSVFAERPSMLKSFTYSRAAGIGLVRPAKRVGHVLPAQHPPPQVGLQRAVAGERLVHHVPRPDPAAVPAHDGFYVALEVGRELFRRPVAGHEPRGQLLPPNQRVTVHGHVVAPREAHDRVRFPELEAVRSRSERVHLHRVLGGERPVVAPGRAAGRCPGAGAGASPPPPPEPEPGSRGTPPAYGPCPRRRARCRPGRTPPHHPCRRASPPPPRRRPRG